MILTDQDIHFRIKSGHIAISDFKESRLGSNSYDLRLGNKLLIYTEEVLDAAKENNYKIVDIPRDGYVLMPNELYLGFTMESTSSDNLVPQLEGKSSVARLGISVHLTAGFGDIGFTGHWTLEITAVKPVRIYAEMPIAQVYFIVPLGVCNKPYNRKKDAKYANQPAQPVPSHMWKNFPLKQ